MISKALITSLLLFVFGSLQAKATPEVLKRILKESLQPGYTREQMSRAFRIIDSFETIKYQIDEGRDSIMIFVDRPLSHEDSLEYLKVISKGGRWGFIQDPVPYSRTAVYYLPDLKDDSFYTANIKTLLSSPNRYSKAVAFKLVGSVGDNRFEDLLVQNISREKDELVGMWNLSAIAFTAPRQTTVVFDYLVDHEDFGDAHMVPFYIRMDTTEIIKTSYERINDKREYAKILAVQSIAMLDKSAKGKDVILTALKNWDNKTKGYAIAALGMYQKHDLKQYLEPYSSVPELKEVIGQTLMGSSSEEDKVFAKELMK